MRAFNLAEERILERSYCQAQVNRQLIIMACMAALMLLVASASYIEKALSAGKIEATNSLLANAQGRCVRVKREMDEINKSLNQRKWQGQLADESGRWLGMLGLVLRCVPEDVWLDSVKNSDNDATFEITGRAGSFDAVTGFMNALKSGPGFGEVRLQSAKADARNGANCISFALSIATQAVGTAASPPSTAAPAAPAPSAAVPQVRGSG